MSNTIRILSIETSCDETGISVVEYDTNSQKHTVLADSLNSQIEIHKEFGGVFPMLAKREHGNNLTGLLTSCLNTILSNDESSVDAKNIDLELLHREKELTEKVKLELENENSPLLKIPHIDYIAVTRGPGLEPALWVGVSFVKFLSKLWQKPILPINHMEGHISSVLLDSDEIQFPTLALLISGGHTELVDVQNWGQYSIIGKTRDDAVGEAYDKVARILGLEYPGGPTIASHAQKMRDTFAESDIPRPMIHSHDLDLSFSGLKTAVLYLVRDIKKEKELTQEIIELVSHEFENAVIEVLIGKLNFAYKQNHGEYKNLIVAGGVIANTFIKENIDKDWDESRSIFSNHQKLWQQTTPL